MGTRNPNPRRFKIHRTYSVLELAAQAAVHPNTIRAWRRGGLTPIDKSRPVLFHGAAVRSFLETRRANAKQPTGPGRIYCLPCRAPQTPAGGMVDFVADTPTGGRLTGLCPLCDRMMFRRVSIADLPVVAAGLDLRVAHAESSLKEDG